MEINSMCLLLFLLKLCITITESGEPSWEGRGCPPGATGQFPYAADCKKFYNCWKGRGSLTLCAPGTLFNPETLECDFPAKVHCYPTSNSPSLQYNTGIVNGYKSGYEDKDHPYHHHPYHHHRHPDWDNYHTGSSYREEAPDQGHPHHHHHPHHPTHDVADVPIYKPEDRRRLGDQILWSQTKKGRHGGVQPPTFPPISPPARELEAPPVDDWPVHVHKPSQTFHTKTNPPKQTIVQPAVSGPSPEPGHNYDTYGPHSGPVYNTNAAQPGPTYNANAPQPNPNYKTYESKPVQTYATYGQQPEHNPNLYSQQPAQTPNIYGQQPEHNPNLYSQQPAQTPNIYGQQPEQIPNTYGRQPKKTYNTYGQKPEQTYDTYGQQPGQTQDTYGQQPERTPNIYVPPKASNKAPTGFIPPNSVRGVSNSKEVPFRFPHEIKEPIVPIQTGPEEAASVPASYPRTLDQYNPPPLNKNNYPPTKHTQNNQNHFEPGYTVPTDDKKREPPRLVGQDYAGAMCPPGFSGLMPHVNCTKFISCANGRSFVMNCSPGTRFNPNLQICDFAHVVNCEEGSPVSPLDVETAESGNTFIGRPPPTNHLDNEDEVGERPESGDSEEVVVGGRSVTTTEPSPVFLVTPEGSGGGQQHQPHPDNPALRGFFIQPTEKSEDQFKTPVFQPKLEVRIESETSHTSSSWSKHPDASVPDLPQRHVFRPIQNNRSSDVVLAPQARRYLVKRNSTLERQLLRLRGSPVQYEGMVEMQLATGSWGLVCDRLGQWTHSEANIVCRTLGYSRGADITWQGMPTGANRSSSALIATDNVSCAGDEESITDCAFSAGEGCDPERQTVWVRCRDHAKSLCSPGETSLGDRCYFLVIPTEDTPAEEAGFSHGEALTHCQKRGGHLIDITSQVESDFVSEWLLRHQIQDSVMTSGVGVSVMGMSIWMWEGSEGSFTYHNWWPGWEGANRLAPKTHSGRALCILLKRHFPCSQVGTPGDPEELPHCDSQYYFWDVEDCGLISNRLPYVCERPANKIGCIQGTGASYKGAATVTRTGTLCLPWDDKRVLPLLVNKISDSDRKMSLSGHNYCRNVVKGSEPHPWCYVKSAANQTNIVKELCDIPVCSADVEKSARYLKCPENHFYCGQEGECIPVAWVCDGRPDCSNSKDETECMSALSKFDARHNYKLIESQIEIFIETPLITCAQRCLELKDCRSFSYLAAKQECIVSESNVGISGALKTAPDWDYYEFKSRSLRCNNLFVCDNGKCLSNSSVCNGRNDCGDRSDERNCPYLEQGIQVRLSGGRKSHEGTVQVKVLNDWGLICDDMFDLNDANVICRHIGFPLGAVEVRKHSTFNHTFTNVSSFIIDDLACSGNETSLAECHHNGWGIHDCGPDEAAGVVCKLATQECGFNYWQCEGAAECIPLGFLCDNVPDCSDKSDELPDRCQLPVEVRLVGGVGEARSGKVAEGRVEVRRFGVWGTVCDDDFGPREAQVVCNALGLQGSAKSYKEAAYGAGAGIIWLDQVHCRGNETGLSHCLHDSWGQTNCRHDEDVSVSCLSPGLNLPSHQEPKKESSPPSMGEDENELVLDEILPERCGQLSPDLDLISSGYSPRVVSGFRTVKGSYPWQASVRVKSVSGRSSHWCGAVLVTSLHAVTAGHCLRDYIKSSYFIRAGDYDTENEEGTEQELEIEELWIHPALDKELRLNNDLAVVKVKQPGFKWNSWVAPVCLPTSSQSAQALANCTISGWGSTTGPGAGFARTLHAAWIQELSPQECRSNKVYGPNLLSDGMFCAGSLTGGPDSCQGDSGGPFLCPSSDGFILVGVTSWGHGCGRTNSPGVYTNVTYYLDWIQEKIVSSMRQ